MAIHRIGSAIFKMILSANLLITGSAGMAQGTAPNHLVQALTSHFQTVTPEMRRQRVSGGYGETISGTAISQEAVAREVSLFKEALATGLVKSPDPLFLALGHNLIVHDPGTGLAYLKAQHETADLSDGNVGETLVVGTIAAGEPGEMLAVSQLASKDGSRRSFWAHYLEYNAIFLSSAEPIQKQLAVESDPAVKASLLRALSMIGSPTSLAFVKDLVEHTTDDAVQAAAMFAFVELAGYDGIPFMEAVKPVGEKSSRERQDALGWLKAETRPDAKHGRDVTSNTGFVARFGTLFTSPVMRWLSDHGLLKEAALRQPPVLGAAEKAELLELLIDSKGFGLEAVKGALFRSLSKQDEASLLRIRTVSLYSPNELSMARLSTVGIMVRRIRQEL
ncbi:MAG: HEAT repeat domain-containing protein [Rhodoferax sp.]|uniref:HEAT repeat domain-containing protein n=1 Tax=Rhodoferax sp. TaxID=50421 RepID=UPI00262B5079|nr:HEAT repeat domain-containing protein [Rhodoferax sp.]MDD5333461.1 HEAT repeat domain-containing protein [Rhodoferax sp.]